VTRPECGNGNGTVTGKFNAAFASGGPACTIKAVEALTDVRIDHFVVVNFLGFKAVVDALGGVPICVSSAIDDPKSHLTLSAGTHVLQGDQALAFARARKTLGDGSDLSRIDRQQVFMSSVVRTATSSGLLTNPLKLFSVLDAVTKSLTVDPGLGSVDDLKDFALSLQGLSPKQIHFTTVPWAPKGDGANIVWNTTKADQIWQAFRDDTPYPPKTTAPAGQKPLTVAPSAIRVKVLNGSGVNGRARTAAQQLTTLGFVVTGVATAPATVGITTVAYDPSASEAARTLAYAARTTSTSPTTSGRTLTLTVGKDWTSARSVTVVTGSTSTSSSSTLKTADQNTCVS
jgi:LCP family protein required for cell wall assembly